MVDLGNPVTLIPSYRPMSGSKTHVNGMVHNQLALDEGPDLVVVFLMGNCPSATDLAQRSREDGHRSAQVHGVSRENDYSEPVNPVQIEHALREISNRIAKVCGSSTSARGRTKDAKRAFDQAFARAVLAAEGLLPRRSTTRCWPRSPSRRPWMSPTPRSTSRRRQLGLWRRNSTVSAVSGRRPARCMAFRGCDADMAALVRQWEPGGLLPRLITRTRGEGVFGLKSRTTSA